MRKQRPAWHDGSVYARHIPGVGGLWRVWDSTMPRRWEIRDYDGHVVTIVRRPTEREHSEHEKMHLAVHPEGGGIIGAWPTIAECAVQGRDYYWSTKAALARDDDPSDAMHVWEAARPRSSKTSDARAEGQFGVGPSDVSACEKAVEFRERPPEGHVPIDIPKNAAIVGTLLHDAVTAARRAMYPWRQFGLLIDIPGLDRPGEADEVDAYIGRVTDYKTAGRYKWELIGKDGPPESEWEQVLMYAFGLASTGVEIRDVELLYINRESGDYERFTRPYAEPLAKAALGRLHAMMDALEAGDPLPRRRRDDDLLGPTSNTLCARYCPHVKTCWNLDEVPPNRTPEGYLMVQPDDKGTIAATLEIYDEARATENVAKKSKEYSKTLVTGLEPGIYGDMVLNWTGGNTSRKPDPVARTEQLAQAMRFAIETDTPPPDPDELPYPEAVKTPSKSISIKRQRAAEREAKK